MADESGSAPVQNCSMVRTIMLILLGVIVGCVLVLGGEYALLRSGLLSTLLSNYFITQSVGSGSPVTHTPQPVASTSSTVVLIPKSYVQADYYTTFNKLVNSYNSLAHVDADLTAVLLKINALASSGTLTGILDLVGQAQSDMSAERTLLNTISQQMTSLTVANNTTADSITKSLTLDLISKETAWNAQMQAYLAELSDLFLKGSPSSAQIDAIKQSQLSASDASKTFKAALEALITRFNEGVTATGGVKTK